MPCAGTDAAPLYRCEGSPSLPPRCHFVHTAFTLPGRRSRTNNKDLHERATMAPIPGQIIAAALGSFADRVRGSTLVLASRHHWGVRQSDRRFGATRPLVLVISIEQGG